MKNDDTPELGPALPHSDEPDSRRGALAALVVLLLAVLGGLWLTGVLHKSGDIQDCVMAGRRNCAPISSGG